MFRTRFLVLFHISKPEMRSHIAGRTTRPPGRSGTFSFSFLGVLLLATTVYAQAPQITGFSPDRFTLTNSTAVGVSVQFDRAIDAGTINDQNLLIYGERSGYHSGSYAYNSGTRTATFTPSIAFEPGERVTVILTQGISSSTGTPLDVGFVWEFYVQASAGTAKFTLDSTYSTGKKPNFVAVADINNDSHLDIAVVNSNDDDVLTMLNIGNGDFSENARPGAGTLPRAATLADFDKDGDLDMAVANETDDTVTIFSNNGDGTFSVQETLATGTSPVFVTHGDLNSDGFLDVVVVNKGTSRVAVYLNDGAGSFDAPNDFGGVQSPEMAFVADFDNTGSLDLVVTSTNNDKVALLLNDGTGSFGTPQTFATDFTPRAITGHDFDGDGFIDVATSNRDGNSVSILINNGGSFAAPDNVAVGDDPFSISAGDLDGDDDADLTVSNKLSNNVHVLLNDGAGTFQVDSTYTAGSEPRALNTGDFDGDGILDIAVSNRTSNTLQIFLNGTPPIVNSPPQAPALNSPADKAFFNPTVSTIVLNWGVPVDPDSDPLHFLVEISQNKNFTSPVVSADSRNSAAGFSPTPPVAQNVANVSYTVSTNLVDGDYWWRVTAHDGTLFGAAASPRKLTVDASKPAIDQISLSNPAPAFAPNWYNQNIVTSVDFVVQYDETNADRAVFSLGVLGGTQTNSNLTSGLNQTTQVSLNIDGVSDGTFTLSATVIDSANNQTSDNTTIALDSSPPTGTEANSPTRSQEEIFTVTWSGGSDGTGSGLSGKYDVRFQVNGGDWTNWLTDTDLTSSAFSGQHGNLYGFEAVGHDNVGNVEPFTNLAETTTEVDTTKDVTAPGAPVNLTASGSSPSPWQNSPDFTIAWQNPSDESGIARTLYKLGPPPTSDFDTTRSVAGSAAFTVSATEENGQNLYIWFIDNASNVNFENNAVVNLRYDATPPTNTVASSPSLSSDLTFAVTWTGTGDDGNGSGLAGKYDIRFNVDNGTFINLQTGFEGTSIDFTGEHGHTYGFEVAAHDFAGNIELFTSTEESTTEVDTTAKDITPPGPPVSLLAGGASPSPWQRMPQFTVTWQAPQDPSGIEVAWYKLGSAPVSNVDTTGSVRSGSSFTATARAENGQDFYLWFQDQSGNVDFRNHDFVTLRYDGTPPEIFEMDLSNADFFPGTGSGPQAWYNQNNQNTAQFLLEYDELHVDTVWLQSTRLDTNIIVEQPTSGQDVAEEFEFNIGNKSDGLYDVRVTLVDSAGNVTRDSTQFGLDTTSPSGTVASSPDTSNSETFTVSWSNGSDGSGSGFSGRYTVRVQVDDGDWQDWLTDFDGTSSTYQGSQGSKYAFEVAAYDNVGNIEALLEIAESTTVVDTGFTDSVFPTIQHVSPLVVDEGKDTTIIARIEDNAQVVEALLFYKASNAATFQSVAMVRAGADTFKAAVTAGQLSTIGINYFIRASDGVNQTFHPEDWETQPLNLSVRVLGQDGQGLAKDDAQPAGTKALAYRMISVPLNLDSRKPQDVLEDDLASYDPKKWRLFQFQTSSATYNEFPKVGDFKPGAAMWLIVKEANKRIDSGVGSSVVTNKPFEITLSEGWNDIGLPFAFSLSKNNVLVVDGSANDVIGPYTFQEQWLLPNQVQTLEPWEGYSFFSRSDGVKLAIYPANPPAQTRAATFSLNMPGEPDWSVGIEAYCEELVDQASQLGVAPTAAEEWDGHDYPQPPFISDFISVRFRHEQWSTLPGVFKTDFRPPTAQGHIWRFEVATSLENERVALRFNNLASLPADFEAILLDRTTFRQLDIRNIGSYEFMPDQTTLTRQFDLVIGTKAYVEDSEALTHPVPESFALSQNYPNPFNAGTTLVYQIAAPVEVAVKVLNILGQEVRLLVRQKKQPGVYRVHWDGKDDRGLGLSTGVYFIRLQAGQFQQIRKVLFVR